MKPRTNEDYWGEVESCMSEETASGYKMAIIEADKILRFVLKQKGYPGKDLRQQIFYAGWRLDDKTGLNKAIAKKEEVINNLEYRLSTFEAEDATEAYKEAILHFSSKKTLKLKDRLVLYYTHYLSIKSKFFQKSVVSFLAFFLAIKVLDSTEIGRQVWQKLIIIANFIFSWFLVFLLLGGSILVIVIGSFLYFEKGKTRIKE
ncbi:hypothetical protein COY62_02110 [bacterium (Candidatus Howlettbacteria) CG_4_10_14_0_8_um_filter_40_9]|nr:MAG: hypothetical protein COY62_02110 [bacterium (Candidatus Howlettbacteria) CG_4_10_14_0_8_um_filter_40_9]